MVYAVASLGSLVAIVLAETNPGTVPPWSLPALIAAMGSALVYAYRNAEARANKAEATKDEMTLKIIDATKESSLVIQRFITLEERKR